MQSRPHQCAITSIASRYPLLSAAVTSNLCSICSRRSTVMIGNRLARSMPTVPIPALSKASQSLINRLTTELQSIEAAGTYKHERIITSSQSNSIAVNTRPTRVLNFCANNYLGLSDNTQLKTAAKQTIDSHGLGLSSVRFICGTQDIHKTLETKIAAFHGTEESILYASCFDANAGVFEVLFGADDCVISDSLNHASIIDGIRLCKARRLRYDHLDMADLEAKLKSTESTTARSRIIVTDGVFSMDGHIAPLADIVALAERYEALVFIDECHATGFFGKTGRGTDEYCGVQGKVDIINSTLGKAMGGACGGYTAASSAIVSLLRQRSRPYLFSNALPPAVVGASIACFDMLSSSTQLRDKLATNTQLFRQLMTSASFDLGGSKDHPIVPIMLYDAKLAGAFAERMLAEGVYVVGFSYPVVPKGQARIRCQISAAHSEDDIRRAVEAFKKVKAELVDGKQQHQQSQQPQQPQQQPQQSQQQAKL